MLNAVLYCIIPFHEIMLLPIKNFELLVGPAMHLLFFSVFLVLAICLFLYIMLFHVCNEMEHLSGSVTTKFAIALREISTYKEILRSQVQF